MALCTLANGAMGMLKAKANSTMSMETFMKGHGRTTRPTGKAFISMRRERDMRESGKMINSMARA